MSETWHPGDVDMEAYWAEAIGGAYHPVSLGKHASTHPLSVRHALDATRGTAAADVIVGLVFQASMFRNREAEFIRRIMELEGGAKQGGEG